MPQPTLNELHAAYLRVTSLLASVTTPHPPDAVHLDVATLRLVLMAAAAGGYYLHHTPEYIRVRNMEALWWKVVENTGQIVDRNRQAHPRHEWERNEKATLLMQSGEGDE